MWKYVIGGGSAILSATACASIYATMKEQAKQKKIIEKCTSNWQNLNVIDPDKYKQHVVISRIHDTIPTGIQALFNEASYIDFKMANDFTSAVKNATRELDKQNITEADLLIFVKTCGGELGAVKIITDTMETYKKKYNGNCFVVINEYALSGGSIIALSADEIMIDDFARISKIDPQLWGVSVKHLDKLHTTFTDSPIASVVGNFAGDAMGTILDLTNKHVAPKYEKSVYDNILQNLLYSNRVHGHTFNKSDCKELGLKIVDIPNGISLSSTILDMP